MDSTRSVRNIGLKCVGCGACQGVCPAKCVTVQEVGRVGLAPLVDSTRCNNCGLCSDVCPIALIRQREDLCAGTTIAYHAYSKDGRLYEAGSSGGVVSSILVGLFTTGKIDAAVVAGHDDKLDLSGKVVTSANEVIDHAGSYYHTCRQLTCVRDLKHYSSVAFVGLPCHVIALNRSISRLGLSNVYVRVSLFCSIGRLKRGLLDYVRYKHNVNLEKETVKAYRSRFGKERLGQVRISLERCADIVFECTSLLDFVDYFYTPRGCYSCKHLFGSSADLAVGDDWFLETRDKIGIAVAHTKRGQSVLEASKLLDLKPIKDVSAYLEKSQPLGCGLKRSQLPRSVRFAFEVLRLAGGLNRFGLARKVSGRFRSAVLGLVLRRNRG